MVFRNKIKQFIICIISVLLLGSCQIYRQDVMFQLDEDFTEADLDQAVTTAKDNYRIRPNDWLQIEVFTNEGERIIDPNFELMKDLPQQAMQNQQEYRYLVQYDGRVKLPLLNLVTLEGLSIQEAEAKLEKLYDSSYKDTFVKLRYVNKRAIVLGATGGQVIPLVNENMSLLEVIALAGGMPPQGIAHNIRLIRGYGSGQMEVYVIDLSRISRMKDGLQLIQENDIIYIEPWKRPVNQALRDATPILSILSSVLALILVIRG